MVVTKKRNGQLQVVTRKVIYGFFISQTDCVRGSGSQRKGAALVFLTGRTCLGCWTRGKGKTTMNCTEMYLVVKGFGYLF